MTSNQQTLIIIIHLTLKILPTKGALFSFKTLFGPVLKDSIFLENLAHKRGGAIFIKVFISQLFGKLRRNYGFGKFQLDCRCIGT